MKPTNFCLLLLLIIVPLSPCTSQNLRILQTTDIHGQFEGVGEFDAGWLRLATIIEEKRREAGPENTLLIDCGDTIQGSFITAHSQGRIAVAMLQHLAYDVWVPGNHELDFGLNQLLRLVTSAGNMVLNGNLRLPDGDRIIALPISRKFDRGGMKIMVIGLNSGFLEHWHWGDHVTGYEVTSAVSVLEPELERIRGRTDIDLIILAIHQGLARNGAQSGNEISEIARRFPEIDIILGGHVHREIAGRRLDRRSWYVQAGAHAETVAVIEVEIESKSRKIVNLSSHLARVEAETPRCPLAERALATWLEPARQAAEHPVGYTEIAITARRRPGRNSQTEELINQAITAATGAEIVIHSRLSNAALAAGPISQAEVFNLVPYENKIGLLQLTRAELITIIEEQVNLRRLSAACGVHGLSVVMKDGKVADLLNREGISLPADNRLYPTAFNSYTLAGGGNRFPQLRAIVERVKEQKRIIEPGIATREALVKYLQQNRITRLEPERWRQ